MRTTPVMKAVLLCLMGAAAASHAQTTPVEDPKKKAEEPAKLDTVVVTSNRRLEVAQKVSGVVQSIAGDQLRKDGITEVRQLQGAVPGLNIGVQEGNVEIYIRGVGSANNTELGDPGAAPHFNGVYIPRPRGLGTMFYDLERVEVNKGPQGTLYGRNAMAGTLNILSAKPKLGQTGGYVQAEVSNRSGRGAEGALNLGLGSNMALRGAFSYVKKDYGFVNHTASVAASTPGASSFLTAAGKLKPAGLEDNWGGRLSWLWDLTPSTRLSVVVDGGHESGTGYPGANINDAVKSSGLRAEQLDLRNVVYRGTQGDMTNDLRGAMLKVEQDFGGFGLEATVSRRTVDFAQTNASSSGIDWPGRNYSGVNWDDFSSVYWQQKSTSTIGEVRLVSTNPASPLQWSAGVFGFDEDQEVGFLSLADAGYCCYSGTEFTMPDVKGRSSAVFGDATFKLNNEMRVIGGLRYTRESKSRFGIGGNLALTLGAENFDCCIATRFGTEGFRPNLLGRPSFNVTGLTRQQQAQFLIDASLKPGGRDTMIQQIIAIANGTNDFGTCFTRPDISNGGKTCPVVNPSDRAGGFSYANLTIPGQQFGSSKATFGDFRLGYEWDLRKDTMVYAKVSTGHKAGGFNDSFGSEVPETYAPEKLTVAELGLRNAFDFMGRRAVANVTAFAYRYNNQTFQDLTCIAFDATKSPPCTGYSLVNRNIGGSRINGLEFETRLQLPDGFKLDLNASLLDTKITRGVVADARAQDFGAGGRSPLISLVGNELPLASKFNMAVRLQQVLPLASGRLDWQLLASYRSSYYLSQFNEQDIVFLDGKRLTALAAGFPDRQQGFTTFNLGIGYQMGGLRVEAFANNLTNEQASNKAIVGSNLNIRFLNDARSYGLRTRYDF